MFKRLTILLVLSAAAFLPLRAQDKSPLFINLHSDGQLATMALTFGGKQLAMGHPVTIFINNAATRLVSLRHSTELRNQQDMVNDLLLNGAVVLVAPMFMATYGVSKDELLPGVQLSTPALGGSYLFKSDTRTLSW